LVAPAVVGFEHADLRAGVRSFSPDQDPHPLRPARRECDSLIWPHLGG
jgi:hypothetical protein